MYTAGPINKTPLFRTLCLMTRLSLHFPNYLPPGLFPLSAWDASVWWCDRVSPGAVGRCGAGQRHWQERRVVWRYPLLLLPTQVWPVCAHAPREQGRAEPGEEEEERGRGKEQGGQCGLASHSHTYSQSYSHAHSKGGSVAGTRRKQRDTGGWVWVCLCFVTSAQKMNFYFQVGERVVLSHSRTGVVRFTGTVSFASGYVQSPVCSVQWFILMSL